MSSEDEGFFSSISLLDTILITGLTSLGIYYFFFRKHQQPDIPVFKKLSNGPILRNTTQDLSYFEKMKNSGRNLVIFYGSQTGTAEEFAGRLAKEGNRYGLKALVADPEESDMEKLSQLHEIENSLAIFMMATYGEGDPTDNCQEFYDWLKEGDTQLYGLRYAVFGLGNKTYEHYNAMGKFVDQKLSELGGERIVELGLGDDDSNIEEDFITWKEKFWPTICEYFNLSNIGEDICMRQYTLILNDNNDVEKIFNGEPNRLKSYVNQRPPFDAKNPFLSRMLVKRELHHASSDRSCLHIELDITNSKLRYEAGDHVALYPPNDAAIVEAIGTKLCANLDQAFTLTNVDEDAPKKHPFPCPTTYRTALTFYLDINCLPRTNVLKELSDYAADDKDKQFLLSMIKTTQESKELYLKWIVEDHRTLLHILEDLPSINPPIDHICELLPRLQPRYYSISSSSKQLATAVAITAVVVDYVSLTNRRMRGVATGWLDKLRPLESGAAEPCLSFMRSDSLIPLFMRKSQFKLPFKSSLPVVMIGPGTGIAPFRGFLQERLVAKKDGKLLGDAILYFGCRHEEKDFIYREELEEFMKEGILTRLHVAFSRDQADKVYVQHLMEKNGEELWQVLHKKGHIFVCGDARHMSQDVDMALQKIVCQYGNQDTNSAQEYLKRMRSSGRYSCDVWS